MSKKNTEIKTICTLAKDLLPLYADDLISSDSKKVIEEHLKNCEECRTLYETVYDTEADKLMKEEVLPATNALKKKEDKRFVRFMKTVKKTYVKRACLFILAFMIIMLSGLYVRFSLIGYPLNSYQVTGVTGDGDHIVIDIFLDLKDGESYRGYSIDQASGILTLTARRNPLSYLKLSAQDKVLRKQINLTEVPPLLITNGSDYYFDSENKLLVNEVSKEAKELFALQENASLTDIDCALQRYAISADKRMIEEDHKKVLFCNIPNKGTAYSRNEKLMEVQRMMVESTFYFALNQEIDEVSYRITSVDQKTKVPKQEEFTFSISDKIKR